MKLSVLPLLIRCQLLALLGIVTAQALGAAGISSLLFAMTFLLTCGIWLVRARSGISPLGVLGAITVLAAVACTAGNALLTETAVSPSYFRKVIMFSITILLFGSLEDYCPRKELVCWIRNWNALLAMVFVGLYLIRNPQMHLLNGRVSVYLTFRFTNPNLAAVFLSGVCMLELIGASGSKGKGCKGLHLLLAGAMAFFVWETRARNAQLILLAFALEALLWSRKRRLPGIAAAGICLLPMLFAAGYLLLIDLPIIQEQFRFLVGEGKGLNSRQGIWQFAWNAVLQSPLLGAYSQISGGSGASQMHNSHLDVLASYGGGVFCLFCLFLYGLLEKGCPGNRAMLCRLAFAALLLSGMGEAMLFSGGMGIYILPGMTLMLANDDFEAYEDSVFQ